MRRGRKRRCLGPKEDMQSSVKGWGESPSYLFMNAKEIKALICTAREVQELAAKEYGIEIPIRTIQEAMKNQPANPYGVTLDADFLASGRRKVWFCTRESACAWIQQYAGKQA